MKISMTVVAAVAAFLQGAVASADDPAPDIGAVVLTVAGDIETTNRPPFDEANDTFFGYHETRFERAFAFDRAMLDGFGVREAVIDLGPGAGATRFSGPRLADVLDSVGCRGSLTTLALDGFGTVIEEAERAAHDWMLVTRVDGRAPGLGDRGPLSLVFDPPGDRPATPDEKSIWPWGLFFIRCGDG